MTDLQIGLIIIGVVIIAIVVAYNKWQTHRAQSVVKRAFAEAPDDVLMRSTESEATNVRREPVFVRNTVAGVELQEPLMEGVVSISGIGWGRDGMRVQDEAVVSGQDGYQVISEAGPELVEEVGTYEPDSAAGPYVAFDERSADEADAVGQYVVGQYAPDQHVADQNAVDQYAVDQHAVDQHAVDQYAVDQNVEEQMDVMLEEELLIAPARSAGRALLPVDDLIDYSISLFFAEPLHAERIMPLIQPLRSTGSKPVHFIGLSYDERLGEEYWQVIAHGGLYHQLRAAVQLANRTGALNEIEYSEFITRLRQLAESLNADIEVPDMTDVLREARDLYRFVVNHDARLGINVRTMGSPWAIRTLVAVLERQKLDMRPDGLFVRHDVDGSVLFSLVINASPAAESASRMTLLLDVPCVMQDKNGFEAMVSCARELCLRLNGVLVDDEDKMLTDPMLSDIAGQVNVFYEEMKAASIPAGSTRALRIFG